MRFVSSYKYIFVFLLLVLALINFMRTTARIMESSKRYTQLKVEISSLEQEKETLEKSIEYMATDKFVEEEARNKLSLVKSGEDVFLSPTVLSAVVENYKPDNRTEDKVHNVILWVKLIL